MTVWGIMYICTRNSVENNRYVTERRRKMKSFFEDLGKKIGETTETVTSKAGEMMEIQRLRGQIRTLERGNEADMLEMGRFLYEKYRAGEEMDEQVQMLCEKSITEQKVSRDIRQRSRRSKERVLVQNVENR